MDDNATVSAGPPAQEAQWPALDIDRRRSPGLVEQIVSGVEALAADRRLAPGTRMPSVRQFARCNGVSTFTVVEAYDRLVTLGVLTSRRGSGYYVTGNAAAVRQDAVPAPLPGVAIDALSTELYTGHSASLAVGSGWLPPEWYSDAPIVDAVRQAMRMPPNRLRGYGHPLGFPALRQHLARTLSEELVEVQPDQVILTHGTTHAIDLVLRTLTRPGDVVLMENPGYSNLLSLIRHHGCVPVGIRRDRHGLDVDALAREAAARKPKLMFVNTVLHNPLGTSLSQAQTHQLLALAEDFDFWLVEDDMHRELAPRGDPSLAAMDGLRRVIRVSSFSKTLSPALRVGSICASASLVPEIVRVKMLTGLTTSEITERAVYHAICTSAYRRMLERLRNQLDAARARALEQLTGAGLTPLAVPRGGMFVSAGWPCEWDAVWNGRHIASLAQNSGILLAPSDFFTEDPRPALWFRFNVAWADAPGLLDFLRDVAARLPGATTN